MLNHKEIAVVIDGTYYPVISSRPDISDLPEARIINIIDTYNGINKVMGIKKIDIVGNCTCPHGSYDKAAIQLTDPKTGEVELHPFHILNVSEKNISAFNYGS